MLLTTLIMLLLMIYRHLINDFRFLLMILLLILRWVGVMEKH